ncbi:MAG: glycosyltransferase [Chitinophagaceae bacterium]
MKKKRLLIFVDWFLPGFKAGGQLQSCANLVAAIQNDSEVFMITSDRDLGDATGYPDITPNTWLTRESIKVYYASPGNLSYKTIRLLIAYVKPDSVYLNSMFSFYFTILPIAVCANTSSIHAKIVLAPRGMLHQGALQFKRIKKQFFLRSFKLLNLHSKIIFHATDKTEKDDIKKFFGKNASIDFVPDFPQGNQKPLQKLKKEVGNLKCIFVSRISEKKNLLFLLELLAKINNASIQLTIVGPIETPEYWEKCKQQIARLPSNIQVDYTGPIPNSTLPETYAQHHLFVLTTHGENFGHVIFESLINGRPVLISDQTPWQRLQEKQVGWDIDLKASDQFIKAIESAANWEQETFDQYCNNCWHYAENYIQSSTLKQDYLTLLG